jgi:hypothetical protein
VLLSSEGTVIDFFTPNIVQYKPNKFDGEE